MKKHLIIFIIFSISVFPQKNGWINYTNGDNINCTIIIENVLWVGTNGGLVKINLLKNETTFYNIANSDLTCNTVNCITKDDSNNLWIATNIGICEFDGLSTWITYTPKNSDFSEYYANCLKFDKLNNLWIGTYKGLIKYDGVNWHNYFDSSFTFIDKLDTDQNGNVWIGSRGNLAVSGYLAKFDGNSFTKYDLSNSPKYFSQITCILVDDTNNVWIGHESGLAKYNNKEWQNYDISYISALAIDNDNILWAGGSGEIIQIKNGDVKIFNQLNSPISYKYIVSTLMFDHNNTRLIGTFNHGLFIWSDTTFSKINTSNSGITFNNIHGIAFDDTLNMWVTSANGIAKFDGKEWTSYNFDDMNVYGPFFNIAFDDDGNVWAA